VVALGLIVLLATTAVGIAGAARQDKATAKVGTLELTVDGSFGPKVRRAPRQTPIRLDLTGEVREAPGAPESHPPAIRELLLESADLQVHTRGIPACRPGQLQATEARVAEKVCRPALIGAGTATAQVKFAEQSPIDVKARALVFNGGTKGGKTTVLVHTYFPNPISGAIVTTVTVTGLEGGHLGTLAVAKIPQITGGYGSITALHLTIDRKVAGGNPVSATCEGGRVRAYVVGKFEDGTRATTEIVRPCKP
jgi:hypothetical protein